jgi:hypothetical protein
MSEAGGDRSGRHDAQGGKQQRASTEPIAQGPQNNSSQQPTQHSQAEDEAQSLRTPRKFPPQQRARKSRGLRVEPVYQDGQKAQRRHQQLQRAGALSGP